MASASCLRSHVFFDLSTDYDDRLDDDDIDLIEENLGVKVKRVNVTGNRSVIFTILRCRLIHL